MGPGSGAARFAVQDRHGREREILINPQKGRLFSRRFEGMFVAYTLGLIGHLGLFEPDNFKDTIYR